MNRLEAEVLIVGAGPAGLTAAVSLARLGITSLVLEYKSECSRAPKARVVTTRSMEVLRQLGIEGAVAAEAMALDSWRFLYFDYVNGREWARVEDPVDSSAHLSPTYRRTVMQSSVEAALLDATKTARESTVLFGMEVRSISQDSDSVVAGVFDHSTQTERDFRGRFLLGADGTQSTVRSLLGCELVGEAGLAFAATIHHRTNLAPWLVDRPSALLMTTGKGGRPRITGVAEGFEEWVTMFIVGGEPGNRLEDLDEERCRQIVREVVGVGNIDTEILHVGSFATNFQLAPSFRQDRVFLVGDAAHRVPPAGGFGMNIGLQSAHNLAWKLAAVLRCEADHGLLSSYDSERRQVAEEVGRWSHENGTRMAAMLRAQVDGDDGAVATAAKDMEKYVRNIGIDLGVRYLEGALIPDGGPREPVDPSEYRPSARPGARAPHCWIERHGDRVSTLDLFGRSFVLLGNAGNTGLRTASEASSRTLGVRIEVIDVGSGGEIGDPELSLEALYELSPRGAVLVRPDGYIAWRCEILSSEALTAALRTILDRESGE